MYRAGRRAVGACIAAVTACAVLGLASCSSDSQSSGGDAEATKAPAGLEKYYAQQLAWKSCEDVSGFSTGIDELDARLEGLECAWLEVPVDYEDPSGDTIDIAVARSVAENSQGSLVFNPGGPGASGVDFVPAVVAVGGSLMVDSLDVVGFDPRGVGRSAPIDCVDDAGMDALVGADIDVSTEVGLAQAQAQVDGFIAGCKELTGPVLAHVDTISAARDMDVLRAALRESTLNYLGVSYGTKLGATYAQLFPDRVGAMVLDAVMDPTASMSETMVLQAGGFESALRAYAEDCLQDAESCPLSGTVDEAMVQIVGVIDQAEAQPMDTPALLEVGGGGDGRVVTGSLARTGIAAAMYDEEAWEDLTLGLEMAMEHHDGSILLFLADQYNERCNGTSCPIDDGYMSDSGEALVAINCADLHSDVDDRQALADEILAVAPIWGQSTAESLVAGAPDTCDSWPYKVGPLPSYEAKGAPPIVLIGTTNDPATPYAWAQSLATMLDSGVLITNEGEGHGGYLGGKECVQTAVDEYLVHGKVPEDGLTCA